SVGALFEFGGSTGFNFPDTFMIGGSEGIPFGQRLFIRPLNPTNTVEFLSRVDVTSGGVPITDDPQMGDGLDTFQFSDLRLGILNHAHEAIGPATFQAAAGTLTVGNLPSGSEEAGVSVELNQVGRFRLSLAPVELATNGASLEVSAIGVLLRGDYLY